MHTLFSRFISILCLLLLTSGVAAAQGLEVASIKITKGELLDVPVMYTTPLECLGFQAEVTLPMGLSFVAPNAYQADENAGSSLFNSQLDGNVLKVAGFTTGSTYPSSGTLFFLKIKAADDFTQGSITFSNIILSDKDHREIPLPVYTVLVTSDYTDVESVTLSAATWEAFVGEKLQLTATVQPADATDTRVTWTSSDVNVAKVEGDGTVTAVAVGTATITASAGSVTATCTVTVKPILVASITLSLDKWEGKVGESVKLSATVLPENATDKGIVWSSSDEKVAKVDSEGNVTAVAVGEAEITAKAADESGVTASCKVTVVKTPVSSIELSTSEWTGHVGESFTLTAKVTPEDATDKAISWSSNAPEVASVSAEGVVTALAVGEAVVTASTPDGVSASCIVRVTPILVESISLSPESWSGEEGESFEIIATVLPGNATDKSIVWSSSDESVAMVSDSGVVSVLKPGECVITAFAADGSGIKAECHITSTAGVEAIFGSEASMDVYSSEGVLVRREAGKDELRALTPGIYIVRQGGKTFKIQLK